MNERSAFYDGFRSALSLLEHGADKIELRKFLCGELHAWQCSGVDFDQRTVPKPLREQDWEW